MSALPERAKARPAPNVVEIVERRWTFEVTPVWFEDNHPFLTAETLDRLAPEEQGNPCGTLGFLATLFLLSLDFGIISGGLTELGFAEVPEAGMAIDVWNDLQVRLAEDGGEMSNEDVALHLRLLGIHACDRRGRAKSCGCLATFSAEELHTQIEVILNDGGSRPGRHPVTLVR